MDAAKLRNIFFKILLLPGVFFAIYFSPCEKVFADAPYITDDAGVMDEGSWDAILYATVDKYKAYTALQAPALEIDFSLIPNIEIDLYIPYLNNINSSPRFRPFIPNESGFTDTDVEFKYNLLKETRYLPAITMVPNIFIPNGNVDRALGNGRTWFTFPIAIAKTFGKWVTYAELGFGLNSAPAAVNYLFGGCVVERAINDKLALGVEVYSQGKSSLVVSSYTLLNLGVSYKLDKHFTGLLSLGHGIIGAEEWTSYAGISYS